MRAGLIVKWISIGLDFHRVTQTNEVTALHKDIGEEEQKNIRGGGEKQIKTTSISMAVS